VIVPIRKVQESLEGLRFSGTHQAHGLCLSY